MSHIGSTASSAFFDAFLTSPTPTTIGVARLLAILGGEREQQDNEWNGN
jgi:hypothetical protein